MDGAGTCAGLSLPSVQRRFYWRVAVVYCGMTLRTHCKNGHPFDEQNTYIHPARRGRTCRACGRETKRRGYVPVGEERWSEERKLAKIEANISREPDGCWLWIGKSKTQDGYGLLKWRGKSHRAHRFVYEMIKGPIPGGAPLDHLCRVRACVNPDHLEPTTVRINTLRGDTLPARNAAKTHCPQGHPYSEENTYRNPAGQRTCRTCNRAKTARYQARLRVNAA